MILPQLCRRYEFLLFAVGCCAVFLLPGNSCAAEPAAPEKLDPEHAAKMKAGLEIFQKEVRGVLVGRCVKCHGGEKTEGKFDLNSREELLKGGETGKAVIVGDGKKSLLYKLITHEEEPNMPEDGAKLPDNQIAAIAKWIDLGAPYDKALVEKNVDPLAWIQKRVEPAARDFWSFQPLRVVAPPQLPDDGWSKTPADRFVLAKLREKGLAPNATTDKRKLIRRAYFDVIGLPPPAAEVEQFVADNDPEAYKKLLDRLFDSPHYGERWGRHWLDVARFAESHGFEQDYDRPHAYHYRDFVIKALNADMPFNQFAQWQIAGDELEPNNPLAKMATGFLGAGVFPTQLTEKEFESARYDELDDMTATLGTAMLGLTIGCARCHDHKFDPIPAADYYRMASTFTTAIRSNVELDLSTETNRTALVKWEQEHEPLVAELARFEREALPARFDAWLAEQAKQATSTTSPPSPSGDFAWVILDLLSSSSSGGATLTKQDDGSVLATGTNPDFDKYILTAQTQLTGITTLRLEALAHESMTRGGPGRAGNGNIGLSNLTVLAEPLTGEGKPITVKLTNARGTFEQNKSSLSLAAIIDGDAKSGWAVDPQFGKNHAVALDVAEPFGFPGGTKLTFTLEFNVNNKHNIGRPRLAISTSKPAGVEGKTERQNVVEVLALIRATGGQPNAAQRQQLQAWYRTTDAEWNVRNQRITEHLAAKPKPHLTQVMIVSEGVKPIPHHADDRGFPHFYKEMHFVKRGDASQKHGVAPQSFLQVLMRTDAPDMVSAAARWQVPPPTDARTSYRRASLAKWLADTDAGAGQLLARVIVNRLWQHHFGHGIVTTVNDFGFQGQRPTHPELLDWLAAELINNGWRLKPIHKLMMSSAVYMQTSENNAANFKLDPSNQWFWRHSPQRLEAEVIRDAMLAATGTLDRTQFGPGTLDEGHKRRSIYFMIKRSKLIPSMQLFDAPEPLASVGDRPSTTIAPQALLFMNNPQVRSYARNFARNLLPNADKSLDETVRQAYLATVSRPPTADELRDDLEFIQSQTAAYNQNKELALTDFCQVLLCMNEFVYVD